MKSLLFAADARGEGGRDFDDNEEFEDGGETADVNWHQLHLESLPGKGYKLIDYRSTILSSIAFGSVGLNTGDHLKRTLSSCLRACANDINFIASMSSRGVQTPQQNTFAIVNKEVTMHLSRLVALSLKRRGHVTDPVIFLCVRHENSGVAMVFEPGETFGFYLNYCTASQQEAGVIISLHHPTLGHNRTLEKLLLRKGTVRTNEVLEVLKKLKIALNKLSEGGITSLL